MKRKSFPAIIACMAFIAIACSHSSRITASWVAPQLTPDSTRSKTVFIASLSRNMEVRTKLEDQLAKAASDRGIGAIKSTEYFAPDFYSTSPGREQMMGRIRASGADAILTVALIDQKSETRYVPGTPYSPYTRFGWYGGFYNYYNYWYPFINDPGHYVQDKTYFLETNLYSVADEKLIWSGQSETVNPSSIDKFARDYPKVLVKRMQSDGLLK